MSLSKRKIVVIFAIIFIILAFPVSLVFREVYDLSEALGIAIPSFIFGIGVGMLFTSIFISGPTKKKVEENKPSTEKIESKSVEVDDIQQTDSAA